jgi:hypothetical protein
MLQPFNDMEVLTEQQLLNKTPLMLVLKLSIMEMPPAVFLSPLILAGCSLQ